MICIELYQVFGVLMTVMVMTIGSHLEPFFRYFELTYEEKWLYAQVKLVGKPNCWLECNHRSCRSWVGLQNLLHARYAPHLSAPDCTNSLAKVQEMLADARKRLVSQAAKSDTDPKPDIIDEPHDPELAILIEPKAKPKTVIEVAQELEPKAEPEPKVFVELMPLVEETSQPLEVAQSVIDTSEDFPAKLTMELLPSSPAMMVLFSTRFPDVYDHLQIFLSQQTSSWEMVMRGVAFITYKLVIAWDSGLSSTFSGEDSNHSVACAFLELPSTATNLSRKPIPPPLPWFNLDACMLGPQPPPWPD